MPTWTPAISLFLWWLRHWGDRPEAGLFCQELGRCIAAATSDPLSHQHLLQRVSIVVQHGNAAAILVTMHVPLGLEWRFSVGSLKFSLPIIIFIMNYTHICILLYVSTCSLSASHGSRSAQTLFILYYLFTLH